MLTSSTRPLHIYHDKKNKRIMTWDGAFTIDVCSRQGQLLERHRLACLEPPKIQEVQYIMEDIQLGRIFYA